MKQQRILRLALAVSTISMMTSTLSTLLDPSSIQWLDKNGSFFGSSSRERVQSMQQASVAPDVAIHLEDMPSNHNSDPSVVPQLRRGKGKVQVSWSGIRDRIIKTAALEKIKTTRIENFTATLVVNGMPAQENIPWNQTSTIFNEPPAGQMDYYIVYKEAGNIVDISKWAMRETSDGQNIEAGSFHGAFAGEAFGFHLNEELKNKGFNETLSQTSVRLGNLKVVWVLNPAAQTDVRDFIRSSAEGVDVKPLIGADGEPTSVVVRDRKTKKVISASKKDFHFKVDAAFNGNAFFWDDMLVALATAPYHPWLAKSTLEFWLQVQAENGGVIPREVRKDSLVSLWFPESVNFPGVPKANLSYTNPYLMNWVADKIYRFNPSAENLEFLKRASHSVEQYAGWMEAHRSIKDASGQTIGFNGSSLGTGLDNSRGDAGNDNDEAGYHRGFVDFISQHISMLKDNAKWNLIFARSAKSPAEKLAYVAKARESQRRAMVFQKILNEKYWNQERGFYFDIKQDKNGNITQDTSHTSISGFWAMYAGAVDRDKIERMVEMQFNPEAFGGEFPLPANARNSIRAGQPVRYSARPEFVDEDGYWDKWAHWPSMLMVVVKGLRESGRFDLAHQIAAAFIKKMAESSPDTVEESYGEFKFINADGTVEMRSRPLQHAQHPHRADFAGWGKGPGLENTVEDGVGLNPTYRRGMEWNLRTNLKIGDPSDALGVNALSYNGGTVEYIVLQRTSETEYSIKVKSEKAFELKVSTLVGNDGAVKNDIQARSQVIHVEGNNVEQVIKVDMKYVVAATPPREKHTDVSPAKMPRSCEEIF